MKKLMLIVMMFLICGCSNYNDISNIAVISLVAIDYDGNNYISYVKVLSSNSKNEENLYKEECPSLANCFERLNNKLTKRIYLTHMDLLVLSNNLNIDNYNEIINFFTNEETSRNSFNTVIVNKIDDAILNSDTNDINSMLDLSISTNLVAKKITLTDIIKDILNYKVSYIPYLEIDKEITVKGYKVIYDDNKVLTKGESIALNIIKNLEKNFTIMIDNKIYKLEECNTINKVNDNKVNINLNCKYEGNNKKESKIVEDYLKQIIENFIKNNNDNYFRYLMYKYKKENNYNIDYQINIKVNYQESIGGNIFE